jgi:hypothetical protein
VDAPTTLIGIPYPRYSPKSGWRSSSAPIVVIIVPEFVATVSPSTRWFQTFVAGKSVHAAGGPDVVSARWRNAAI